MNITDVWKQKYGRVFALDAEGKRFYYRPLIAQEISDYKGRESATTLCDSIVLSKDKPQKPGTKMTIINHVLPISMIDDVDDLKIKIIEKRDGIEDDLVKGLIIGICRAFSYYTPDMLMGKTLDQLLDLTAMAELVSQREIVQTTEQNTEGPTRMPMTVDGDKFTPPDTEAQQSAANNELAAIMAAEGGDEDLNQQMVDLRKFEGI